MGGVSLTLFTQLWTAIVVPIQAAEQPMIAVLQGWVTGWFSLAVGAYLMGLMLRSALYPGSESPTNLFGQMFLAGAVWSIATTAAGNNQYVLGFINGLISSISSAIAGIFGSSTPLAASTFDKMANQLFAVGLAIMEQVPSYAIIRGIVMGILVDAYVIISMIAIMIMFVVYVLSAVMLQFLLGFSPFFIALYMFPFTRNFFDGWLRQIVAAALTQIFIVALLTMFLSVLATLISTLTAGTHGGGTLASAGGDIASGLFVLSVAAAMVGIFAFLALYAARLAQDIAGGMHANFSRLVAPSVGAAEKSGGGGGGGGGGGSGGGGGGSASEGAAPRDYAFARNVGGAS